MNHYIYRIDRPATGEWYIGIRSCKCWPTEDARYLGSGRRVCSAVKKHGRDTFDKTILAIVETRQEAARIEAALVGPAQVADRLCMNLCEGGDCGAVGYRHTKEALQKMSASHKGRPISDERIERMRGRRHTARTKAKMSSAQTPATRSAQSARMRGRIVSDETRAKTSASWTLEKRAAHGAKISKRKISDQTRARMSAAQTPERRAAAAERMRKLNKERSHG